MEQFRAISGTRQGFVKEPLKLLLQLHNVIIKLKGDETYMAVKTLLQDISRWRNRIILTHS